MCLFCIFPPPQDMISQDTQSISELEAAHAASRAAAIDVLLNLPPGTTAAKAGAGNRSRGGGSSGISEIEPAEGGEGGGVAGGARGVGPGGAGGPLGEDDDEFAGVERRGAKKKATGKGAALVSAVAAGVEEREEDSGEPLWKRQLKQAAKDTFHRVGGCFVCTVEWGGGALGGWASGWVGGGGGCAVFTSQGFRWMEVVICWPC